MQCILFPWYVFTITSDKLEHSKKYVSFNLTETKHVKSLKTFINLVDTDTHARTLTHTHTCTHTHHHYTYIQSYKALVDDMMFTLMQSQIHEYLQHVDISIIIILTLLDIIYNLSLVSFDM